MIIDRLDKVLTILWAAVGVGWVLKPSGYLGWTDTALWLAAAWMVVLIGMWYLSATKSRA